MTHETSLKIFGVALLLSLFYVAQDQRVDPAVMNRLVCESVETVLTQDPQFSGGYWKPKVSREKIGVVLTTLNGQTHSVFVPLNPADPAMSLLALEKALKAELRKLIQPPRAIARGGCISFAQ